MQRFSSSGMVVVRRFLDGSTCERLLQKINAYRRQQLVPNIYRPAGDRPLNYSVIDGERITESFPELLKLYESVIGFVRTIDGAEEVAPLGDTRVACNVNITASGGTYRYHYDRNAFTAILYLNDTDGGETECYPNYRIDLRPTNHAGIQQKLDQLLQTRVLRIVSGKQILVKPEPGKLLVMRGDRCLHSVRPVLGDRERINVVMAYDHPNCGESFVSEDLDGYLYQQQHVVNGDPNYKSF